MPPAPNRSRKQPARPATRPHAPNPANLYVSPRGLWLGVLVIGLLTIVSFEVGYLLGKPRGERRRDEPRPEVAAAPAQPTPAPKPPAKDAPAPAAKSPAEPAPSAPKPPAKPPRPETTPAVVPRPEPPPKSAGPAPTPRLTFAADILPVFQAKCVSCHGGFTAKGKLDVRTLDALARGGNAGPSVSPGNPEVSPLWTWVNSGQMPPKGKPQLTAAEKKLIHDWIADGAK
jgi:hypothetical protein